MNEEFKARVGHELAKLQPRSRLARSVESALGRYAPALAMRRERQRVELARFRAQGAYPNSGRGNASPFEHNPYRQDREQRQLMWNSIEQIDNSGLAESITSKVELYTVGSLRYQARTGDAGVNKIYEDLMREKTGVNLDIAGESTLRKMCGIALRGRVGKGGAVFDLLRSDPDDPDVHLRGIEYDRIGSPWDFRVTPNYIGGFHLGPGGRKTAVDVYSRDRMGGYYTFEETIPIFDEFGRRQVMHLFRPTQFDPHKGVTAFKTAIDNIHYLAQIRLLELQTMQWAATQTAIYYTQTGEMPERPFQTEFRQDGMGGQTRIVHARGPELSSMSVDEKVEMFDSQRPSPNVLAMFLNTVNEVCIAVGLPMTFVYGMNGNGPGIRFEGAQADRAIGAEFATLDEQVLTPVGHAILQNAIRNGEAPFHPLWKNGRWIGPAKLSIDAGYDSAAALNENKEGVISRSSILMDRSVDEDEEAAQVEAEANDWIDRAKRIAKQQDCTWQEILPMLRQSSGASSGVAPTLPSPVTAPKDPNAGATSDGVDVDPDHTQKELKALRASVDTAVAEIRTARLVKDASGHDHDDKGRFPSKGGGSGGKKDAPAKKAEPDKKPAANETRTPPPKLSEKAQRAKDAHVMVDKDIQRYAEEHNEPRTAKALGGVSFPNGEPIDIAVAGKDGKVAHGVELKTVVKNANGKITMKGDAIARKAAWEKKNKAQIHTVVLDDSAVKDAHGPGQHDESKRKIYYANGYGSFRIGSMHPVEGGMDGLKKLMNTPYKKLPAAAQKRK